MIGFPRALLVDNVLTPQGDAARGETRAILSGSEAEIDLQSQELDVLATGSVPTAWEIGGSLEIRHTISVAVVVQHGDLLEASRLRDAIVLELILRATSRATRNALANAVDPAGVQEFADLGWSIDYRPLRLDTPNENATITFAIDTRLDR